MTTGRAVRGNSLRYLLGVLLIAVATSVPTFGSAAAQQANPCEKQAGAHNPNCQNDGTFDPPGQAGCASELPNCVSIDPPSSAAGTYGASGAAFGPEPSVKGIAAAVVLINSGGANPTEACAPLAGFPAGAIALIDRGSCLFTEKVSHAQDAGAVAVVVVNSIPGDPVTMASVGAADHITIPSVMVSLDHGTTIKQGLPATGRVSRNP